MQIDFISDINKGIKSLTDGKIDLFMVKTLWWHTAFLSLFALGIYAFRPAEAYPSPYSWRLISLAEALWTVGLGVLTASAMTFLRGRLENHYIYRFFMANALMVYSYLLVYITGGSIEAHFHFFIMFGLLVLYHDWRLGWWAIVAVALHHAVLNYFAPYWVYFYGRNDVAFTAHAVLVMAMAVFTTRLCIEGRERALRLERLESGKSV